MSKGWTAVSDESLRLLKKTLDEYDDLANCSCVEYPSSLKRVAEKMAGLVREVVDCKGDEDGVDMASTLPDPRRLTTTAAGLTLYAEFPVKIDDLIYPTAMNAFQAHKAPVGSRDVYTRLSWFEAVSRGRTETIDRVTWDTNREALMVTILTEQAKQNRSMRDVVMQFAGKRLSEDSMLDHFWPRVLPDIWKAVKLAMQQEDDANKKKRKIDNVAEEDDVGSSGRHWP